MMHPFILYKLLVLTLSIGRAVEPNHFRTIDHIPKIHASVFALPAISAGVTAILEAIVSTTAALLAAKAAHDWCEVHRLEKELKELEEELEEAEAEAESASEERENDESSGDEDTDEQDEPKTVEDILEDAEQIETTSGGTKQWVKGGGYTQAEEDFDSLQPTNVKDIPYGKTGVLADGRKVTVRSKSLDTRVTLEIQSPGGKPLIKIRYN